MGRAATRIRSASITTRMFAGASPSPDTKVPIPPRNTFNQGLTSADERTMIRLLGTPGAKTSECSPVTGSFKAKILSSVDVGPFKVSGLNYAVNSLKTVFEEAEQQIPDVVAAVNSAGMLCVRSKRHNRNSFSNHSWGTAIDLYFGRGVVGQGDNHCHQGCLQLAPFFNRHGWYWGAGFSGRSVDSMHFELAKETIEAEFGAGQA
ncbi:hypothetical protein XH93_09455 [Bradyrhizobium sp. CCBAU 51753]|nr:hypothetical protein XH93_09455 [Bradyrhizobium sp. CCBAU 51753]